MTNSSSSGSSTTYARDPARPRVAIEPGTSYAAVAFASTPAIPSIFNPDPVMHLARRATFAPRPSDLADIRSLGIDSWISRQLSPDGILDGAADAAWALFPLAGASVDTIHANTSPTATWDSEWQTATATLCRQILSNRQLYEQVVDVMGDLLHVAVPSEALESAPSFNTDVIRRYALGRYSDMLVAAMRHPAMMRFLNNDVSTKTQLNENLGRELLELHTVGPGSGYTETEVVSSAKILTGRMVTQGSFIYRPEQHWTGAVSVLGWSSSNSAGSDGLHVGDEYVSYLAHHPATARRVASRLAVHFVCDQPPSTLIDRMAATYLANDTSLRAVMQCLFRSPEFWASTGQKTRRPLDDLVGTARVLDMKFGPQTRAFTETVYWILRGNGHAPLGWIPPNGYPDVAAAWSNAGSLINRWTMHRGLVANWWKGMTTTPMQSLVPMRPEMTAGQWVDELCIRLVGQPMSSSHRSAVVSLVPGASVADPASRLAPYLGLIIPLVFDSPYFQLR